MVWSLPNILCVSYLCSEFKRETESLLALSTPHPYSNFPRYFDSVHTCLLFFFHVSICVSMLCPSSCYVSFFTISNFFSSVSFPFSFYMGSMIGFSLLKERHCDQSLRVQRLVLAVPLARPPRLSGRGRRPAGPGAAGARLRGGGKGPGGAERQGAMAGCNSDERYHRGWLKDGGRNEDKGTVVFSLRQDGVRVVFGCDMHLLYSHDGVQPMLIIGHVKVSSSKSDPFLGGVHTVVS